MNSTTPAQDTFSLTGEFVVYPVSAVICIIAIIISIVILILVRRTKPLLHTVRHLLMCNTSMASILYCIVQTINYVYLILLTWETSDVSCRWRGYFAYFSISAVTYSYFLQAISRAFICLLSHKYRWLTTFRTHYILILIQWVTVTIVPLTTIVTKDIYYRPASICWVPMKHFIHVLYTFLACYIIPTILIGLIYVLIYYRVKKATNRAGNSVRSVNSDKRDLELLRNILVLLGIYLMGGVPSILYLMTSIELIYAMSIVSISLSIAVEKICTILLDRDMRQVTKSLLGSMTRVMPFDQSVTAIRGLQTVKKT